MTTNLHKHIPVKREPSVRSVLTTFFLFLSLHSFGQLPHKLIDGRVHKYCESCRAVIEDMPPEVLFGIQVNENGDVYFSMSNKQWFDKIFKSDSYGVTVDIVSKDRYACNKGPNSSLSIPKGTMLLPIYRAAIINEMDELVPGYVFAKIGKLPASLMNKQVEGNLVILNGPYICYYTNFVNLDRSVWQLLPMGLFTDSLLSDVNTGSNSQKEFLTYSKKIQVEIPFAKSGTSFNNDQLRSFYDSLELKNYRIQKMEIRAYSSVEGSERINNELMQRRADAMIAGLKAYQLSVNNVKIITAENWLSFFKDIEGTKFSSLQELSKAGIKQKLTDKALAAAIEPLLAPHRKVIATLYLATRSAAASISDTSILGDLAKAVMKKDVNQARLIQKELAERIIDKRLPVEYINKIEVPKTKEFSPFLNDREVYKYLLRATSEYEALDNFLSLRKIDPLNGRINYNICALRFFTWQYAGDSLSARVLLKEVSTLAKQGISDVLVKRMLINYHILKCEDQMKVFNYDGKDSSLSFIKGIYESLDLNDDDLYSLAKYFSFYSQQGWAEEMITPRIDKMDVSEDLLFYYLNLQFFHPYNYNSEDFRKAVLNGINLNRQRFCNFFLPNDHGGAGMQLLEYEEIKKMYCEECQR